jgi:glutaredoxin 3
MAKVIVYKKDPCPYCDRAINLLSTKGIAHDIIDLTGKDSEIQKIKDETGWRTVPIIMINGKLIGGYTDLKELDDSGKLLEMLSL